MKIISAFILIALAAVAQDRMADALRKGIVEEEARQDLSAAIKNYESALTQFGQIRRPNAADRKTAASALFRMAECYRKQGRADQAASAYSRLVSEFSDQGALVAQSRARLATRGGAPDPAAARKEYRALLERAVTLARVQLDYVQRQFQLGAISESDTYDAQRRLAERERQLAAYDAGLIPFRPAAPASDAGRRYRQILEREVQLAERDYEAKKNQYNLGALDRNVLTDAEDKIVELQLELAAFDATQRVSAKKR